MIQKPKPDNGIQEAIDTILFEMRGYGTDTPEYANMVDQLVKLHALKANETKQRMSPDTKATIIANLAGILLIIGYERAGIITSKALGFVLKLR